MFANGTAPNHLYRSRRDKKIAGVAAGLSQYLNVDVLLVRMAFVLLTLTPAIGGFTLLAYIALALLVPQRPLGEEEPTGTSSLGAGRSREIVGFALLGCGLLFLAGNLGLFHIFDWNRLGPLMLIGVGLLLIVKRVQD